LTSSDPPPEGEISKRQRVSASLAALPDIGLPNAAKRILDRGIPKDNMRNAIEDVLWAAENPPRIPKRARRDIARALDIADLVRDGNQFLRLLERFWLLNESPAGWSLDPASFIFGSTRRTRIVQHVIRNLGDWSAEDLFQDLGAFDSPDMRFARFIEGLTSADVVLEELAQQRIVDAVNPHLRAVGFELRETSIEEGYAVFAIVSTRSQKDRRPKNVIFASKVKPDIRIRDSVDNDIEIVNQSDDVLIHDRPIGADGIRWRDLQGWWKESHNLHSDDEAKSDLYRRLRRILPERSDQQRHLFDLYHEIFSSSIPDLPALLPEVWLHWDHQTVRQRGAEALLRFRMDFLLLLPGGHRIVLEVDGRRHYATKSRVDPKEYFADPKIYAANMHADRDLKLSGYEVFRFGAAELENKEHARELLREFFVNLFDLYNVPISVSR